MGSGEIPNELGDGWFLSEIAYRAGLGIENDGGRHYNFWFRGPSRVANSGQLQVHSFISGSQTVSDKIHSRKGNGPDHQLRSPNNY